MSEGSGDPVSKAAVRLEAAVEALARALARTATRAPLPPEDMVPRAEVAAMAERLDATIARLRLALAEEPRHPGRDDEPE